MFYWQQGGLITDTNLEHIIIFQQKLVASSTLYRVNIMQEINQ